MSTASPLPLPPLPPPVFAPGDTSLLKQQVASRLAEHRLRRPRLAEAPTVTPEKGQAPKSRVASSVAARFAESVSYRDFLQAEAQAAIRKAEAAAEVARRSAEAIAAAQTQLLQEIEHWNAPAQQPSVPAIAPADEALLFETSPLPAESAVQYVPAPVAMSSVPAESLQAVVDSSPAVADSFFADSSFFMPVEPAEPAVPLPTNLLEFPRQLVAARRARPRLAEGPLREEADAVPERAQLRIFEVEAASLSPEPAITSVLPEWHTIRLDAPESARAARPETQAALAAPVFTAPLALRVMAVTVDACCILAGFLSAVATAAYASPVLPTGLPAAAAAAGTLFLFSVLYYMLFFSLNDATPGMRYARIGLCTFSDDNPTRASMRRRFFAVLLAGIPLGLGWVWACMDEDGLGWHDRISRMYPREY